MDRIVKRYTKKVVSICRPDQSNSDWICSFLKKLGKDADKTLNLHGLHMLVEYFDDGEWKYIDCSSVEEFSVDGIDYKVEWDLDEDEMELIYISGKITGMGFNNAEAKFADAEEHLLVLGYIPLNPITYCQEVGIPSNDYKRLLNYCIKKLIECDGIYMLNNWQRSYGAEIEMEVAYLLQKIKPGFKILYEDYIKNMYEEEEECK
jgi:hypothetical protein